jgi:farnesyl-diphosphate farnesyltransferase
MSAAPNDLLTKLLRDVSRSFYLTMRVLPLSIRPQISLAYLLARATDTVADTDLVPVDDRLGYLRRFRDRIQGTSSEALEFKALSGRQRSTAEQRLLERAEEAMELLGKFSYSDQQRLREVLLVITSGQELDLQRFAGANEKNIIALATDAELDDYTYRVAGCVGEFWTRVCRAHLFPQAPLDETRLLQNAVRFGKGLQLVNILRDLPRDVQEGRSYLPIERLGKIGLAPQDLRLPVNAPRLKPLYHEYLDLAQAHLAAGWEYTDTLPRRHARVRLACAWPILIGVKTLAKLRQANVLDSTQRVKISRAEIREIMFATLWRYPFNAAWRGLFEKGK